MTSATELREALREVEDPETGLNIIDLGLVYDLAFVPEGGVAQVTMTFTSPFCPAGGVISEEGRRQLGWG